MGYVDWFATMRANVFFDEVTEPIEKDVFLDSKGAGQKTIIPSYSPSLRIVIAFTMNESRRIPKRPVLR